MPSWSVRLSDPEADAAALAPRLRATDRAEIAAGTGRDPEAVLQASAQGSRFAWTAEIDGQVILMLGTAQLAPDTGCPWLLGAEGLERHPGALTKLARAHIEFVSSYYPRLENHVYAESRRSVRWLQRLGFEIHAAEPYGVGGALFHRFTLGI